MFPILYQLKSDKLIISCSRYVLTTANTVERVSILIQVAKPVVLCMISDVSHISQQFFKAKIGMHGRLLLYDGPKTQIISFHYFVACHWAEKIWPLPGQFWAESILTRAVLRVLIAVHSGIFSFHCHVTSVYRKHIVQSNLP